MLIINIIWFVLSLTITIVYGTFNLINIKTAETPNKKDVFLAAAGISLLLSQYIFLN
jgi:hypothetical protein